MWYPELLFAALENQKRCHPWWHTFVCLLLLTSLARLLQLTEGLVSIVSRVLYDASYRKQSGELDYFLLIVTFGLFWLDSLSKALLLMDGKHLEMIFFILQDFFWVHCPSINLFLVTCKEIIFSSLVQNCKLNKSHPLDNSIQHLLWYGWKTENTLYL